MTDLKISSRSVVVCKNGCVASPDPLASQAGLDILKAGGNAADAAVAIAAALNVTQPMYTGLGGDAFIMFYDNSTKTVKGINGSGRCPRSLSLERLASEGFDQSNPLPIKHAHCVTVPGAASVWVDAVAKYGSGKVSLQDALQPAIDMAETGFPVQEITAKIWHSHLFEEREFGMPTMLSENNPHGQDLLINGRAPKHGEIMYNKHLANVLKDLAAHGKSGFYSGRVAEAIVKVIQSHGGDMSAQDLASYAAEEVSSMIYTDYRGCRVWEFPPNSQGLTTHIALNILEGFDLKSMGHNSASYIHHIIDSLQLAFMETLKVCGDPDFSDIPVDKLISKEYAAKLREKILPDRASNETSLMDPSAGPDTVAFTTADSQGNACSFVSSIFLPWGTGLVPEACGFALHNRGFWFSLDPNHPNALAPEKRPFHSLMPAIVTSSDTNELLMAYALTGAFMQPHGHVQLLLNMLEFGYNPQTALEVPRFIISQRLRPTYAESLEMDSLGLEDGISDDVSEELKSMGHNVVEINKSLYGRGQIISRGSSWWSQKSKSSDVDAQGDVPKLYWAGSDRRADGCVAAY